MTHTATPAFAPLVETCRAHGIGRSVAFELAKRGDLETFHIGARRFVYLESLRTLPQRLAARDAKEAA
ncbi:MAG: hypothetical protein QM741_13425 [Rudaea sp.]|uniref:hypothetical protein n=1 Tax=Rudaea sp. TaxID=2136325 RepID=UPI0039E6138B